MKRRTLPAHERRMTSPVRCLHCRTIYDMGAVQPIGHFADCTTWRCPGCNLLVDDRSLGCGLGPVGRRDIERVRQPHPELTTRPWMDQLGHTGFDHILWPPPAGRYETGGVR